MKNNTIFHVGVAFELAVIVFSVIGIAALLAKPARFKSDNIMKSVYVQLPGGKFVPYSGVRIRVEKDEKGRTVVIIIPKEMPKDKDGLKRLVREVAEELNYKNHTKLFRIIQCESGWKPKVTGPTKDYGLWQIVPAINKEVSKECALDPYCSTRWAVSQIKAGNDGKWNASRYCWEGK